MNEKLRLSSEQERHLKPFNMETGQRVYFLYRDGELVYIGYTTKLYVRLADHSRTKYFDHYFSIPGDRQLESFLIKKFKPWYNGIRGHKPTLKVPVDHRNIAEIEGIAKMSGISNEEVIEMLISEALGIRRDRLCDITPMKRWDIISGGMVDNHEMKLIRTR